MAGQPAVRIEIAFVGAAAQMRPRPAFWPRDNVRIVLRCFDAAAAKPTPVDGRGIRLVVQPPGMAPIEYTEAELTQDAPGVWHLDTVPDIAGAWRVEGSCTEPVEAAAQARFDVRRELIDGQQRPDAAVLAAETGEPILTPGGALLTVQRVDRAAPATALTGQENLGVTQGGAFRQLSVQALRDDARAAATDAVGEIDDLTGRLTAVFTMGGQILVGADGQPLTGEVRDPYAGAGLPGKDGEDGEPGGDGRDGWTPRFAVVVDGERRVLQLAGWIGGTGLSPGTGYVTAAGALSQSIADGVDLRGPQGLPGSGGGGGTGLSPIATQQLLANVTAAAAVPAGVGLGRAMSFRAGLLAGPLPWRLPRIKVLAFGDSITQRQGNTSYATWAFIRSRARFDYQANGYNRGISGNTLVDLLARFDADIVPYNPDVLWVAIGTNDAAASVYGRPIGEPASLYTFDQTIARFQTLIARCLALGIQLWIVPVRPRGPGDDAAQVAQQAAVQAMCHRINNWLHSVATTTPGVLLMDSRSQWVDPATGYPRDLYVYPAVGDQVHPSPAGALEESDTYVAALETLTHAGHEPRLIRNPLDVASVSNPGGNLLVNGLLVGAAGTRGAEVTGAVATGWNVSTDRAGAGMTGTIACTLEDRGNRGQWQVIQVASRANPAGSDDISYQELVSITQAVQLAAGTWQVGDLLQAICEVEVSSSAMVAGVSLEARYFAGGSGDIATSIPAPTSRYEEGPRRAWSGILMPDPIRITAPGTSAASFRVRGVITLITRAPGASVTAKFGQMTLRTGRF